VAIAIAAGFAGTPLIGQTRPATVAVLPFENAGSYGRDRESFDGLKQGLAAILASELAAHPELRVIGRPEVQQALRREGLGGTERLDRATIGGIGKLVGAQYLVSGSFIDLYGDFRIDARLIDAETGDIVKSVRSDPALHDRADLHRMLQSVAQRLAGPPLTRSAGPPPSRLIPTEALSFYSLGLLHLDRGDRNRAAEFFRNALAVYPDFAEAKQALAP
jgi:TolB-like protein